ncbi:putative transposon ATPase protein TniB [Escherichia coli]|nr:putative transposon ATPase protein TniB [Escherichia coli]
MRGQTSNACPTCCWLADNNGKSMIVEKFRRTTRPARRRPGAHPGVGRADAVRAVRDPLYVALLAAMGAPLRPRPRLPEMEQLALALLRKVGVRMLVIDEACTTCWPATASTAGNPQPAALPRNELRIPRWLG